MMDNNGSMTPDQATQAASTASESTNKTPQMKRNPNRKQRRSMMAMQKRFRAKASLVSRERLDNFKKLTAWKDKEVLRKNRLTDDQIASVFRVTLARLFKGKEIVRKRKEVSFDDQLKAIILNVKRGFKYKSDIAPTQKEEENVEANSSATT